MNQDIINLYIERLLQEIQELKKNRLLVETQLKYVEKLNAELHAKLKDAELQIEKLNKRKSKEVNTSDNF